MKWKNSFKAQTGQKPTIDEIKENPGMRAMHVEYHQLKEMSTNFSTRSQSAPDEIREAVSNSASGAYPAPSTSAPFQQMDSEVALLRARIIHRASEEPQALNAGALHNEDELLSLLQDVNQT